MTIALEISFQDPLLNDKAFASLASVPWQVKACQPFDAKRPSSPLDLTLDTLNFAVEY